MNAVLLPNPAPQVKAWAVSGHRKLPDGSESSILGTSFGSTEARARENWSAKWGAGVDWPVATLTFTPEQEGGDV